MQASTSSHSYRSGDIDYIDSSLMRIDVFRKISAILPSHLKGATKQDLIRVAAAVIDFVGCMREFRNLDTVSMGKLISFGKWNIIFSADKNFLTHRMSFLLDPREGKEIESEIKMGNSHSLVWERQGEIIQHLFSNSLGYFEKMELENFYELLSAFSIFLGNTLESEPPSEKIVMEYRLQKGKMRVEVDEKKQVQVTLLSEENQTFTYKRKI